MSGLLTEGDVMGVRITLQNELHNSYTLPNVIKGSLIREDEMDEAWKR